MATKLILINEVSGLGSAGDVVEVRGGYARNYLLPRGLATVWSKGAQGQIDALRKARQARAIATLEDAQAARDALVAKPIVVEVKAGPTGRLFGAVTGNDVVAAVAAAGGPELDKRKIEFPSNIKSVGEYEALAHLHEDIVAKLNLKVVAVK